MAQAVFYVGRGDSAGQGTIYAAVRGDAMAEAEFFNISPAAGQLNSPLSRTGNIAPNRHNRRALSS
jgi:hypothetical protein